MTQKTETRALRDLYASALRDHLARGGEEGLERAYELGRGAMSAGTGVLEIVSLHQEILDGISAGGTAAADPRATAAGRFLVEALSPFEMTHRSFQEAVVTLRRLNEMLEEEARRIAHALHDDAGQLLVSVHLALEELASGLPPRARGGLKKVRSLLDAIEQDLRRLSHELRPTILDDLGLLPAIEFLAKGVAARAGIDVRVEGDGTPRPPAPVETAVYRVVQEALRNATRHGNARRVDIRLAIDPRRVLGTIRDDGAGFDVRAAMEYAAGGLGLIGMRERLNAVGGQLSIQSAPGKGTEIRISIPLEVRHANPDPAR